jgi:hypothetical protein
MFCIFAITESIEGMRAGVLVQSVALECFCFFYSTFISFTEYKSILCGYNRYPFLLLTLATLSLTPFPLILL